MLILDEATSALDYESERIINNNMRYIAKGRTVFIVAHRLSAVRHADRIVVMEKGSIKDIGTHDQLLRGQGEYATLGYANGMNYPVSSRYVLSSGKAKTRDELEFLPAALEIMDTPPNPLGRGIMWVIMLFFITAVVWSAVGRVDIVAVAQGKVIPAGKVKVIQPFEMSTVKAVHVTEDQLVQKGQLLIELDATKQQANITRLQAEDKTISEELQRIRHLLDRLQLLEVSATMPGNERLPLPANDQLSARC